MLQRISSKKGAQVGPPAEEPSGLARLRSLVYNLDHLEREAVRRGRLLQLLVDVVALSRLPLEAQLQEVIERAAVELGADFGLVALVEGRDYTVRNSTAPEDLTPGDTVPLEDVYCDVTVETGAVVAVDEAGIEADWTDRPCYRRYGLESYIGAPLYVRGDVVGTVAFAAAEARGLPFTDVDREFIQTVALWVAKTVEQIEVDRALRESEHRYRSLVENAPFGLVLHDGETVLYCNPGFSELVGGTPAEVINKSIWRFIPEEDRPLIEARIRGVIVDEKKARFLRERLVRLDGTPVEVAVLGVPVQYLGRLTAQALVIRETSLDEFDAAR